MVPGTPCDFPADPIVQFLGSPAVLIVMIALGFALAGIVYFISRDLSHAFLILGALVTSALMLNGASKLSGYLFPTAGATISAPAPSVTPLFIQRMPNSHRAVSQIRSIEK